MLSSTLVSLLSKRVCSTRLSVSHQVKFVAHTTHPIPTACDPLSFQASVLAVCKLLLPGWSGVTEIQITTIPGGITNDLRMVVPASGDSSSEPKTVVLRVFGIGTEKFLDRIVETDALHELNAAGFGAKCLGVFSNGRIEEYLQNVRPLSHTEMGTPGMTKNIANLVARFHKVSVEARKTKYSENEKPKTKNSHQPAQTWDVMRQWHTAATAPMDLNAQTVSVDVSKKLNSLDLESLKSDIDAMEQQCATVNSPTVLLHNDLLPGNFLWSDDHDDCMSKQSDHDSLDSLTLIDFEYSCCGPRGFDLANHFLEFAGFSCDWSLVPDSEARKKFCQEYLKASRDDVDVKQLEQEVIAFFPVSHLWWGLWAAMQAKVSAIDFDYAEYAAIRIGEFRRIRDDV